MSVLSPQTYVIDDEAHQRRYTVSPRLEYVPVDDDSERLGRWQVVDLELLRAEEFNSRGNVVCTWAHGAADRFADRAWRLLLRQPLLRELMETASRREEPAPVAAPAVAVPSAANTLRRLRQFRQDAETEKNRHDQQANRKSG